MGRHLSGQGSGFGTGADGLPHTVPLGGLTLLPGPRPGYVLADGLNEYLNGPRSRNLLTTTRRSISTALRSPAGSFINRAASNGTRVVIMGNTAGGFTESTDGINWSVRSWPSPSTGNWSQIAWNGSIFVAISDLGNDIITSPDGLTWTARTGLSTVAGGVHGTPRAIAVIGTRFVAVYGADATSVFTSTDGITWSASALPDTVPSSVTVASLISNGSTMHYVASSSNGFLRHYTSTNGTSWTILASSPNLRGRNGRQVGNIGLIGLSPSGVLIASDGAHGTYASMLTSFDNGATWEAMERPINTVGPTMIGGYALGQFWIFTQSEFASSSPGASPGADVYTSADGRSWERRSLPRGMPQAVGFGVSGSSIYALSTDLFDNTSAACAFTAAYTNTNRTPVGFVANSGLVGGTSMNQCYMRVA